MSVEMNAHWQQPTLISLIADSRHHTTAIGFAFSFLSIFSTSYLVNKNEYSCIMPMANTIYNKCIEDDTKAVAHRTQTALGKRKIKYDKNDFQYGGWNSLTLQCCAWLWDEMPWIRPNVSHIGIVLPVSISTILPFTAVDMSLCTSLRNVI